MIPGIVAGYPVAGGGGGSLRDEIMADNPLFYLRLGEASGTVAENETSATEGGYFGTSSLGNSPLYTGGPTSYGPADASARAYFPGGALGGFTSMTLGVIVKLAALTDSRYLITRDRSSVIGSGNRYWQWYVNGANVTFTKIGGSVQAYSVAHGGITAGVPVMVHVRVTAAGAVTHFVNGSPLGTGAVSLLDYGNNGNAEVAVGNRGAANDGRIGDRFSEAFLIASDISDARILAHAVAAGFA